MKYLPVSYLYLRRRTLICYVKLVMYLGCCGEWCSELRTADISLWYWYKSLCIYIQDFVWWIIWYSVYTFIRNLCTVFHKIAAKFTFPPAVSQGSSAPHHGLNFLIFFVFIIHNLIDMRCWFALPWGNYPEVENLFLCLLAICMSCSRNVCLSLCTFLNSFIYSLKIFYLFYIWVVVIFLFILSMSSLSDVWFVIFLYVMFSSYWLLKRLPILLS